MNRHTARAFLALIATAAALTIAAPGHAASHTTRPAAPTTAAAQPHNERTNELQAVAEKLIHDEAGIARVEQFTKLGGRPRQRRGQPSTSSPAHPPTLPPPPAASSSPVAQAAST